VFLDEIDTAPLAPLLKAPALAHLNCWARRDRELGAPWDPYTRDSLQLIRADRRAAKRARHLAGCSTQLVADIRRAGANDVQLVRLGLDPEFYKPGKLTKAPIAGLIGSASWPPTRDAVTTLLEDIWPRIHATLPSAVLRLAGHGMTPESFPGYEHVEGVEWLGKVDSASGFLRSLALQLYPVTNGSGTAIKVLESLFLGVPVVTTQDGLEGMSENDGVVVAQDPDEVVNAATDLLSDPRARRRRSKAAIAYAHEHHGPAAVGPIFAKALANIAK
jgi:glycosyltransferase involved in cell wall biosynthesis